MTAVEAAKIIGCTCQHVRYLIRENQIAAETKYLTRNKHGELMKQYDIPEEEISRFCLVKKNDKRGRPRKGNHEDQ